MISVLYSAVDMIPALTICSFQPFYHNDKQVHSTRKQAGLHKQQMDRDKHIKDETTTVRQISQEGRISKICSGFSNIWIRLLHHNLLSFPVVFLNSIFFFVIIKLHHQYLSYSR